jgi:hypothetical protein
MRMPIFVLLSALFAASALAHQWYYLKILTATKICKNGNKPNRLISKHLLINNLILVSQALMNCF